MGSKLIKLITEKLSLKLNLKLSIYVSKCMLQIEPYLIREVQQELFKPFKNIKIIIYKYKIIIHESLMVILVLRSFVVRGVCERQRVGERETESAKRFLRAKSIDES